MIYLPRSFCFLIAPLQSTQDDTQTHDCALHVVQDAQARHVEEVAQLQQDLQSAGQQVAAVQADLDRHPKPEELQR